MFWIALELSIPKIGFNIMLSLLVKKFDAFKFDGVAESDNTGMYQKKRVTLIKLDKVRLGNSLLLSSRQPWCRLILYGIKCRQVGGIRLGDR